MQMGISSAQISALMPKGTTNQQVLKNFKLILRAVSKASDIFEEQILGDNRQHEISRARRVLAYLAVTNLKVSNRKISILMDLDNSSVLYMVRKVAQDLKKCDILTVDLLNKSIAEYKNINVKNFTMSRSKHYKSMVLLGMYDDGMLITIDGESIFKEMNSQQMIGLAIELLERAQISANLPQKESDFQ